MVDPHQAVLISQEARSAGVVVHEFAFTAASVGRLALSLHQAIRNHRMALPDDEDLLDELVAVRLRKNSLGIYRLDHDAGQHDDQAIALALGTHYLLDTGAGPVWPVLDNRRGDDGPGFPGTRDLLGVEVLQQRGNFAYRQDPYDAWDEASAGSDEDEVSRRTVRTQPSPFT